MQFVNELSMKMNAMEVLSDAEYWYHLFTHVCDADGRKAIESFKPSKLGVV